MKNKSNFPIEFAKLILENLEVPYFVETGTFKGATTTLAAQHFKNVITIEAFKPIYDETSQKYSNISNIKFIYGDSREYLSQFINEQDGVAFFWLDAHFSGEFTYGKNDMCPLIKEIEIINKSKFDNIILIDDSRFFLAPLAMNHKIDDWPNITQVINELNRINDRYIIIFDDTIYCVPNKIMNITADYSRKIHTEHYKKTFNSKIYKFKLMLNKILKR